MSTIAARLAHQQRDVPSKQRPRGTIVPATPSLGTTGQRALAAVGEVHGLTSDPLSPSARLVFGATLGQGGMGVVRSGKQTALDRDVAIKTLRPDHRSGGEALKLLQEGWVTGTLEHPNIVPVHDLGLDGDGAPVIVLKRIDGIDWSRLMRDGGEVERRFGAHDLLEWNLRVLLQVARAIEFAHSRALVHRDLKPENVMVGEFGEVYVLDWGIAVSLRPDETRLPRAEAAVGIAGTPADMAPEMLGGEAPSTRTDIYLLHPPGMALLPDDREQPGAHGDDARRLVSWTGNPDSAAVTRGTRPALRSRCSERRRGSGEYHHSDAASVAGGWNRMTRIRGCGAMAVLLCAAAGCGNGSTATLAPVSSVSEPVAKIVEIAVMSGRPQPPPAAFLVTVGAPVTIRLVGLGPPRARISAPDGSPVTTVDVPFKGKTGIDGTELRFSPPVPGVYLVQQADAPGVVLARLNAS